MCRQLSTECKMVGEDVLFISTKSQIFIPDSRGTMGRVLLQVPRDALLLKIGDFSIFIMHFKSNLSTE
jgi:hypothetical protein